MNFIKNLTIAVSTMTHTTRFVHSIHAIGIEKWQSLLQTDYPFLRYEFLAALEDTHCIESSFHQKNTLPPRNNDSGWMPHYALIETQQENHNTSSKTLIAIAPVFEKLHSYGEYVFDWAWADAYQHHGLNYYPKLVWAIPFTPSSGPRIVSQEEEEKVAQLYHEIAQALTNQCQKFGHSGWHCLFPDTIGNQAIHNHLQNPKLERLSCQFHWFNKDDANNTFNSFSHYLEKFTSRKRKNINKERRRLKEAGFIFQRKVGQEITDDDIKHFYHCYQLTYSKRNMRGYLSEEFFQQILASMPEQLLLVQASLINKETGEKDTIASALYFKDANNLYGRYWGCIEEYDSLHFECCYYQGIEYCIDNKLQHFDPGTQGEHKIGRGFEPTLCHSQHWICHPQFRQAIANFIAQEQTDVTRYYHQANRHLPFKTSTQ